MLRVAVVDDDLEMVNIEKKYIMDTIKQSVTRIEGYVNVELLLLDLQEGKQYELFLVDIEMPVLNGLELAKKIRKFLLESYIIFVTSHPEFALQGYDLDIRAFHFIMKNSLRDDLSEALLRVEQEYRLNNKKFYVIETQFRLEKVNRECIVYIYKDGKNAVFVTTDGEYRERKSLEKVFRDLDMPEMIFVERGRIVNIRHINTVKKNEVYLDTGENLEISRAKIQEVKRRVSAFWKERW